MAVSDAIFPVLTAIDSGLLGWLPPYGRVIAWGVVSGILTMAIYWVASPQKRIVQIKQELKVHNKSGALQSEDIGEVMRASVKGLRLSLQVFGLALGASVLAGLPVLAVIFWISASYGLATPEAGDQIDVDVYARDETPTDPKTVQVLGSGQKPGQTLADGFAWPVSEDSIAFRTANASLFKGRFDAPGPGQLHIRRWWNGIIGNDLGYLADNPVVDEIDFRIGRRYLTKALPGWMSTWEFPFFLSTIIVSLAIKLLFRIH